MQIGIPVWVQIIAAASIGFGVMFVFMQPDAAAGIVHAAQLDCDIKGNISIGSGERIYHMPGQEYYAATVIRPEYGERWFCSEDDARAAGWRKAGY